MVNYHHEQPDVRIFTQQTMPTSSIQQNQSTTDTESPAREPPSLRPSKIDCNFGAPSQESQSISSPKLAGNTSDSAISVGFSSSDTNSSSSPSPSIQDGEPGGESNRVANDSGSERPSDSLIDEPPSSGGQVKSNSKDTNERQSSTVAEGNDLISSTSQCVTNDQPQMRWFCNENGIHPQSHSYHYKGTQSNLQATNWQGNTRLRNGQDRGANHFCYQPGQPYSAANRRQTPIQQTLNNANTHIYYQPAQSFQSSWYPSTESQINAIHPAYCNLISSFPSQAQTLQPAIYTAPPAAHYPLSPSFIYTGPYGTRDHHHQAHSLVAGLHLNTYLPPTTDVAHQAPVYYYTNFLDINNNNSSAHATQHHQRADQQYEQQVGCQTNYNQQQQQPQSELEQSRDPTPLSEELSESDEVSASSGQSSSIGRTSKCSCDYGGDDDNHDGSQRLAEETIHFLPLLDDNSSATSSAKTALDSRPDAGGEDGIIQEDSDGAAQSSQLALNYDNIVRDESNHHQQQEGENNVVVQHEELDCSTKTIKVVAYQDLKPTTKQETYLSTSRGGNTTPSSSSTVCHKPPASRSPSPISDQSIERDTKSYARKRTPDEGGNHQILEEGKAMVNKSQATGEVDNHQSNQQHTAIRYQAQQQYYYLQDSLQHNEPIVSQTSSSSHYHRSPHTTLNLQQQPTNINSNPLNYMLLPPAAAAVNHHHHPPLIRSTPHTYAHPAAPFVPLRLIPSGPARPQYSPPPGGCYQRPQPLDSAQQIALASASNYYLQPPPTTNNHHYHTQAPSMLEHQQFLANEDCLYTQQTIYPWAPMNHQAQWTKYQFPSVPYYYFAQGGSSRSQQMPTYNCAAVPSIIPMSDYLLRPRVDSATFAPYRPAPVCFDNRYHQPQQPYQTAKPDGKRAPASASPLIAFSQLRLDHNLISMLPIDACSARTRQAYGMDKVWRDEFEQLFSQLATSIVWTLIEVESNPSIRDSSDIIGYRGRYIVRYTNEHNVVDDDDDVAGGDLSEKLASTNEGDKYTDDRESCCTTCAEDIEGSNKSDHSASDDYSTGENEEPKGAGDGALLATSGGELSDCDSGAQLDITSGGSSTGAASEPGELKDSRPAQPSDDDEPAGAEASPDPKVMVKKFPTKFRMFIDSAKVRFCCDHCGHGWTSMKGRVVFWYELFELVGDDQTELDNNFIGYCAYKLFGQQCDVCKIENRFERPMWYPEEVCKVLNNLYNKIGQIYFGFKMPAIDKQRRAGKPKTSHNSSLCQACHDGVCTDRK